MKVFTLSFKIKPTSYTDGLKSILCVMLDDDYGSSYSNNCSGIWFYQNDSGILFIIAALSFDNIFSIRIGPLRLDEWSTIKLYQTLLNGKYIFNVELNGTKEHSIENSYARDFKNLNIYASDHWHNSQNGSIADLLIINGKAEYIVSDVTPLSRRKFVAEIPKLDKEYLISFDICYNKNYGWPSGVVIDFIIYDYSYDDNYEVTFIRFYGGDDGKLQISATINGITNSAKTNLFNLKIYSNIEVSQILVSKRYIYTIRINGQVIFSIPNDLPQIYYNVKVYTSDSLSYLAQYASIKSFFVVNGIANNSLQPVIHFPTDYINQKQEVLINQSLFLGTLKFLMKVFTLSFKIKPATYTDGLKSVLCLMLDDYYGSYSKKCSGVWFYQDSSGILFFDAGLGFNNTFSAKTDPLGLNQWSTIKVYQFFSDGKYRLNVELNGAIKYYKENADARDLKNIKVYASDPWHNAQHGYITDLLIINGKAEYIVNETGISLTKDNVIVAKIPVLEKEYIISFDIYPDFALVLNNVVRFVNDANQVLDIKISYKELQIKALVNKIQIYKTNAINDTNIRKWSNIEVSQILKETHYIYTIRIDGKDKYSVPNKFPQRFHNVNVYALESSQFIKQSASIKNLFVVNGISNSSLQPVVLFHSVSSSNDSAKISSLNDSGNISSLNDSGNISSLNDSGNKNTSIIAAILIPVLVVLVVIVFVVLRIRKNKSKYQQSKWKSNVYKLQDFKGFHNLDSDDWEIFPENIIVDKKIGEGAFGTVFVGKISEQFLAQTKSANLKSKTALFSIKENVAVKFLKDNANQSEFNDFREEISLMKEIGYHKNIVNMIGCSTIEKPLCLVVEFMENGDLLHYLRNKRNKLSLSKVDGESYSTFMYTQDYQQLETSKGGESTCGLMPNDTPLDNIGVITPDDLLSFSWQVASGMEYLSFAKLVHRDLAARNVLVGAEKTVKISDFGLTRRTNDELNYMSNTNRRLPVKWMSVEAIFDQKFTTYSDVWAYGVVLFEIVTLGGTPYPSMSNHDLLKSLKSGYRMERPENCSQSLYDIMLRCWNEDPLQRPTFTELREHFDKIMSEGDNYCNLDVDEKNTYYNSASFQSVVSETCVDSLDVEIPPMSPQLKPLEELSDEPFSYPVNDEFN